MITVHEPAAVYRQRFEEVTGTGSAQTSWTLPLRQRGMELFSELGIPTPKHEEWKYTDVREVARLPFVHAPGGSATAPAGLEALLAALPAEADERIARIVLVDGRIVPELTDLSGLPAGTRVAPLVQALSEERAELEDYFGRLAGDQPLPFVGLNSAFFQDGVYVRAARGTEAASLHLLHVITGAGGATAAHPRHLFVLEESSALRVVEDYASMGEVSYLSNPVTEAFVGANAQLEHYRIVRESKTSFHLAGTFARLERDAHLRTHNLSCGSRLTRNELAIELRGRGCECVLNGLNVAGSGQVMDDHTSIMHAVAHCSSREYYRSVLSGDGQGVFNGKVLVLPDAQKTDGIQSNHALVLGPRALMNTKPQLEIFADDVRCTHGATIGQLDADSLFYLRSRGIEKEAARRMLVHAFAADVVERMEWPSVRNLAASMLEASLGNQRS